ncbi:PEP-CTERM sorting domain-containing protein [Geitlerinema sp. P-1104]|uniref:PEP-CTERM sorting domain-containing protein n=1 Tax=Geitlerinema sp. P-1104 TaxID=2546230 RepID=UPI0014772838|nr:PEP-CTERM sorting domain-containing protein [Geitlerinema sp. P-1104]NMG57453.1 PEP-CTERM sorting domain-containing protein [Geitlerinema sp. P-1104]
MNTMTLTQKTLTLTAGAAIALGGLVVGSNPALAGPLNPINDFGETQDDFGKGSGKDCQTVECSLQSELDFYTTDGPGINVYDFLSQQYFPTSSILSTLMFEIAGFKDYNRFGVYSKDDPTNLIEIFSGPDSGVLSKALTQKQMASLGSHFGFYLTNKNDKTFYTEHALNHKGNQHAVIYGGNNSTFNINGSEINFLPGDFIIAFEDLEEGRRYADWDYQDMVVHVRMASVPEPSLLLGLGAMAGSLFATRKRKRS